LQLIISTSSIGNVAESLRRNDSANVSFFARLELRLTIKHNQVNPGQFWPISAGKNRPETLHQLIRIANWNWRALWADLISPNCEYGVTPSRL
jgi:hypothetical protein